MKKILLIVFLFVSLVVNIKNVEANNHSSYILMDAESGRVLYEKNKDHRFLTASIAKIMTCMVAIENGNLFDKYIVDYDSTLVEGSSIYLKENDEITLYDLLCGLMLRSGNDAATLIGKNVFKSTKDFVFNMNALAREIGMGNSTFENPTGLNVDTFNYSTAYDMALLMRYAVKNEIFFDISSKRTHKAQTLNNTYYWLNKHKLVTSTNYVICGKTGYTKSSGRTLVSYAELNSMKLVCVSFNEGGDFDLHKRLFEDASKDFNKELVIKNGVYNQGFSEFYYYPFLKDDINILIKKGSSIEVVFKLFAIPKDVCGFLEIYEDNKLIYQDNLYPYYPKS